ncbi:putative inactive receptor kinase [Sesamum angolense]|uniref:Inactive receptor kinase n=1 Tax=Sesamum angolense TaxID=2727404 RepID=A0AAE1XEM5_9LAMI|nr:putative inactive receptor kinase [Sesamum angolense]
MLQPPFYLVFLFCILRLPAATRCDGRDVDGLAALPVDAVALLAFKSKADLDNKLLYTTNERFDYCQWQGVKCAQGRVVRFIAESFGLRGTVSGATLSRLDQLRVLSLRNNSLSGTIPDFSPLVNLKTLVLDHNYFSGTFPLPILSLHHLSILDLSHNNLTGLLPENLLVLDRLGYLRLDSNSFYGPIPPLNQTILQVFSVSYNNLSGPIPVTPTLKRFKISSFLHNPNLCGEIINKPCRNSRFFNSSSGADASPPTPLLQNAQSQQGLSLISSPDQRKHHKNVGLILGFVIGALFLTAAILSLVALLRKRREEREHLEAIEEAHLGDETTNTKAQNDTTLFSLQAETANAESHEAKKLKFPEQKKVVKSGSLVFCSGEEELYTLDQLMRASAELLGRGTIGITYKAVMASQLIVSVKRLDACKTAITSGEEFEQHMEAVGVLRHPNLVPVRAYFQAKQERLIIFDYQPNGSLFNLIHDYCGSESDFAVLRGPMKLRSDILDKLKRITKVIMYSETLLLPLSLKVKASSLDIMSENCRRRSSGPCLHSPSIKAHPWQPQAVQCLLGPDFEACITDYCLAVLGETSLDDDPDLAGYSAPEVRKSSRRATAKSDVYSFGVLLLELLTGKTPSQHPFLAPPDMPDWVQVMRGDDSDDDIRLRMLVEVAGICRVTSPEQRPTMWQVLKMIMNIKDIMDYSSGDGNNGDL